MLLPVLAGLGALSLMSNPRRRRRKARRNPRWTLSKKPLGPLPRYMQDATPAQRKRVLGFYESLPLEELRRRQDINAQQAQLAFKKRDDRVLEHLQVNERLLTEAVDRVAFGPKKRRSNPGPTAKDIRLLVLLQNELALAENRYEMRTHRDDARKLRRAAVEARLRYRRFFRGMEAKTRSNPTAEWENKSEAQVRADKEGVPFLRTWTGVILRDTPGNRKLVRQNKSTWGGIRDVKRPRRSNPMRIVGARPAISRARAKKIAAEYGVKLPSLGHEVMLFKYGRFDTQVWLGNHAGAFIISDHGAIRDPITTEVATKLGIKTNPRRRRARRK